MVNEKELKFTKTHEWISPDGTVGISDHAQKEITDVVFVELPSMGKVVRQGGETGTIESVKAAFPIYAPVSGKISAVNGNIAGNPALINQSPYGEGWLFKLEIQNRSEPDQLFNYNQYQEFLKEEHH